MVLFIVSIRDVRVLPIKDLKKKLEEASSVARPYYI